MSCMRDVLKLCWGSFTLKNPSLNTLEHLLYLLLTNGTPFTYLVQIFASLLTAVNALCFKWESMTKIERFLYVITP